MMAGVKIAHVPYRGEAPALTDLLGGQVQVYSPPRARRSSTSGPARCGRSRSPPARGWTPCRTCRCWRIFYPATKRARGPASGRPGNTPVEIVDKLNREINAALADPKMRTQLADLGATVLAGSPADFGKFIAEETEKWAKVIKFAGIKAD